MSFFMDCTKDNCPVDMTIYGYAPSLGANATFVALFGFSAVLQAAEGWYFRKITGLWSYTTPIILGCITEIIGYIGRLMMWHDPFNIDGFYMQICCLTIAPAFLTASIYFCLSDIIQLFDPNCESSRLKKPKMYAWIFIPCDIVALVLQAAGGATAAISIQNGDNPDPGTDVMIAGLAWQVFSLFCFIIMTSDFGIRSFKHRRQLRRQGNMTASGDNTARDVNGEVNLEKEHDYGSPNTSGTESGQSAGTGPANGSSQSVNADGTQRTVGSPVSDNTAWDAEGQTYEPNHMRPISALKPVNHQKFAVFLIPFILAILTIFMRCCYRVAELSGGWTGHLIREQGTFIGLEGV